MLVVLNRVVVLGVGEAEVMGADASLVVHDLGMGVCNSLVHYMDIHSICSSYLGSGHPLPPWSDIRRAARQTRSWACRRHP